MYIVVNSNLKSRDLVMEDSNTALVLEYHFWGTRTRNPWYSVSTVLVLEGQCTPSKKAPSTRVHLAFARSNKLKNKMNFR